MFGKKIAAMIIAVVIMIITPLCSANAGSVTAMLRTDVTEAESALLGNTTGKYRLVGSVSSSSKYSVEYYVYAYQREGAAKVKIGNFSYSSMEAFDKTYEVDKLYTVANCKLYGNLKSNPKPDCYANGILSNK